MKSDGEISERRHAPGPFRLADATFVLVVGFVSGVVEFVFDSPMFTVVPHELVSSRMFLVQAGDSTDDFLRALVVDLSGTPEQEDLGGERKIDFRPGDFCSQDAVALQPPVGFIVRAMGRGKKGAL